MTDPVFGEGTEILLTQTDGSTVSLELYNDLPFLLIRKELHNSSTAMTDFQKLFPSHSYLISANRPTNFARWARRD